MKVREVEKNGGNLGKIVTIVAIAVLAAAAAGLLFTTPMIWGYGWGCPWMVGPGMVGMGSYGNRLDGALGDSVFNPFDRWNLPNCNRP